MVSDVHSIAAGSGLHISVPSHVTIVTGDTCITSITLDGYCGSWQSAGDWSKGSIHGVSQHRTAACMKENL